MPRSLYESIAKELNDAYMTQHSISKISDRYPELTTEEAYLIQRINRNRAVDQGHQIIGYKVGLTASELMNSMGVDEPDYGVIYQGMILPENGKAILSNMFEPKVEGEIAFILDSDLPDHVEAADVLAATGEICAAFEFPETRVLGWDNRITDTVSDNSSAGHCMLSSLRLPVNEIDLSSVHMVLNKNNSKLAEGSADVVLGNPLNSVAWLSNKLHQHGDMLKKGQFILSGALCGAHLAGPGDSFTAHFSHGLGSLSVTFD